MKQIISELVKTYQLNTFYATTSDPSKDSADQYHNFIPETWWALWPSKSFMWLIIYIIEDGMSIYYRGHPNFCGLGLSRAGLIGFWMNFGVLAIVTSLWIPDLYADWKWSNDCGEAARADDRTRKVHHSLSYNKLTKISYYNIKNYYNRNKPIWFLI